MEQRNIDTLESLLALYAQEFDCVLMNYRYMGMLLDEKNVENRIHHYEIERIYIYGTDSLGMQLCHVLHDRVDILGFVDKIGNKKIPISGPRIFDLCDFEKSYRDEYVIVTLTKYFREISSDLRPFVPSEKMLLIGEFLGDIT